MATVLIIGAGGSLAQAYSLRPGWGTKRPPLDQNFFSTIAQLARRDPTIRHLQTAFSQSLTALGQRFRDPWTSEEPRMETFFAEVYYEVTSQRTPTALALYWALVNLYVKTLCETTNWLALHNREGALERLIRREVARSEGEEVTVVTFNHDLIIENAIARVFPNLNAWCLSSVYGDLGFTELRSVPAQSFPGHGGPACPHHARPLLLLKVHGSLNWGLRVRSRKPGLASLFPANATRTVYLMNSREADFAARQVMPAGHRRRYWYLWNLVVPPIYEKEAITGLDLLRNVRNQAEQRISTATRLLFLGYSMPNPDIAAQQMFKRAFNANGNLSAIDVINPQREAAVRIAQVLDSDVVRSYRNIDTYLTTAPL